MQKKKNVPEIQQENALHAKTDLRLECQTKKENKDVSAKAITYSQNARKLFGKPVQYKNGR